MSIKPVLKLFGILTTILLLLLSPLVIVETFVDPKTKRSPEMTSGDRGVYNRQGRRSVFTQALLYSAATPTVIERAHRIYGLMHRPP